MAFLEILKKPYPVSLAKWPMVVLISVFIGLFLLLFQPFGLQFLEREYKSLLLLGYGVVTFIFLVVELIVVPKVFPSFFEEERWTVLKQILWLGFIISSIAVGNYLYSVAFYIFPWQGLAGLLVFLGFTIPIGLFPAVIITFIQQNAYLKRNLDASAEINESMAGREERADEMDSVLQVSSGTQAYSFTYQSIVSIKSEGNYVEISFLEDGQLRHELIRSTLKSIEDLSEVGRLFRCHRAFIVNLNHVKKVSGNSQGYILKMDFGDEEIPVARSYSREFKEAMMQL